MNIFDECSPRELRILEFFAKAFKENPQGLKASLLNVDIVDRARTIAFIKARVPDLGEDIERLVYE